MSATPDIRPADPLRTVGNGGNGGLASLERRLDRMDARIGERLTKMEERLGALESTANTMKGTLDTWKFVMPAAILVAGVVGTFLGMLLL